MALLTLFTVTTAFMTSQRWIHAPAGITSSSDILTKAAEGYAWQAANVIPVLEVPDTFGWHQPPGFTGTASGVLLLLFKLLVLLPVATSLVYLLRGLWEREPLLPERLEDGPPVPWTRTTGGWEDYLLLREIWKTQKRERHRRRRERLKQTASQLEGMSVDDVYKRGQVAIEAARARARLAGTARLLVSAREAKLWWTLDMFVARHEVFANVVEGDLRRRQARNRLVGHTVEGENVPETASDVTESKTRIVAAMLSVIRANAELSRGWPEVWQQLFEPEPA